MHERLEAIRLARAGSGSSPRPLNRKAITALIVFLGFTSPLSTDMCLPALSTIASELGAPNSATNLVIIVFFLFMAISTLLAGPFSDRYGRKRVMLVSLCVYTAGNALCFLAPHIGLLVFARGVAACGAGGMLNSATALVKDVFTGRDRDKTLSTVQVFQIVAPLLAPVIGAGLLMAFSWRACFVVLCCIGAVEIVLAASQPETQPEEERGTSTVAGTFWMLGRILKNRAFTMMLLAVGCLQACFMAYLATSSYVYQVDFGVSPAAYSLFFSASAIVAMGAPVFYMHVLYDRFEPKTIYRGAQAGILVGGACILIVGLLNGSGALSGLGLGAPVLFWASFAIVHFHNGIARPLGVSILLRQQKEGGGSLSALINFGLYIIGLVGMCLGSLDWGNYIVALGAIIVCIALLAIVLFTIVTRPGFGLKWEE